MAALIIKFCDRVSLYHYLAAAHIVIVAAQILLMVSGRATFLSCLFLAFVERRVMVFLIDNDGVVRC